MFNFSFGSLVQLNYRMKVKNSFPFKCVCFRFITVSVWFDLITFNWCVRTTHAFRILKISASIHCLESHSVSYHSKILKIGKNLENACKFGQTRCKGLNVRGDVEINWENRTENPKIWETPLKSGIWSFLAFRSQHMVNTRYFVFLKTQYHFYQSGFNFTYTPHEIVFSSDFRSNFEDQILIVDNVELEWGRWIW